MSSIWFIAGLVIGILTGWLASRLWPRAGALMPARNAYLIAGGLLVAFAAAATLLQVALSSRRTVSGDAAHAIAAGTAAPAAQSMDAAIARLEARLAREGGSDGDWELLAKAYDFLGRSDDAAVQELAIAVKLKPDDAGAEANLGAAYGELGDTQKAIMHLNRALRLDPGNALAKENLEAIHGASRQP